MNLLHAEMPSRTPPVSETRNAKAVFSSSIVTVIVCVLSSVVFLSIGYTCGWFGQKRKQSHASKATKKMLIRPRRMHTAMRDLKLQYLL